MSRDGILKNSLVAYVLNQNSSQFAKTTGMLPISRLKVYPTVTDELSDGEPLKNIADEYYRYDD